MRLAAHEAVLALRTAMGASVEAPWMGPILPVAPWRTFCDDVPVPKARQAVREMNAYFKRMGHLDVTYEYLNSLEDAEEESHLTPI